MPTEVIMPKVDMDMEEGTIALWHVSDGERVEKDAPLFDIETDKAAMEVESPASGTLHNIIAPAGTQVEIGKPVAWIYADGEDVGAPPGSDQPAGQNATENGLEAANEDPAAGDAAPAGTPAPTDAPPSPPVSEDKPRATPAARRRAKQLEISLHSVEGTGPRGRIQKHDVEAAAAKTRQPETAREPAPAEVLAAAPAPSVRTDAAAAPFVLIHGFAADAAGWAPLRRALGQTVPTHTIELAGHGRQPIGDVTDFSSLVLAVRDELEGLGLAEAHLVGHSLGGAVALAIADQRPSAVATLTLISPAGLGPEIDGATIDGIARATKAESLAPWLKRLVADPEMISWNYVQAAATTRKDAALREGQQSLAEALFPDGVQSFDVAAQLRRVSCPARIIFGKKDRIIPWRHALEAPGCVGLHLFDGLGHMPHLEDPGAVARLLRAAHS